MGQKSEQQTGADLVVQTLERRGTTHVFGVPGAKIDAVFNALVDSSIQTVVCRHEQNAAFIAGGIGRMTGKAGVAIATSGPGVSNLVTGLATANSECDPVVALGGAVASSEALKQIHQTMDAVSIIKPVTKYCVTVGASSQIGEVLANAFRYAEGGRPGAAYVNLPKDVMGAPCPHKPLSPPAFAEAGPAGALAIDEAARLINKAVSPVVFLGLLASKSSNAEAIKAFLRRGDFAVVGTFQAAGSVTADMFDNFGGRVGQLANQPADRLLEAADLVVTIGYDPVEYWPAEWNLNKSRQIIHLDAVPADLDNAYQPCVELVGDVAQTLEVLTPLVERAGRSLIAGEILQAIIAERHSLSEEAGRLGKVPVHPLRLVHELKDVVGGDTTVCLDMGSFHLWLARHLYSFRARQLLISNGQQTLGVALPWAIAGSIVRPSDKMLSISGDGGFLYSAMELETAVRLKANIVHMIWVDGTYDMVATQERMKYGRSSGTDLGPIDYIRYAEAFGATGLTIDRLDDIAPILRKAFDTPGPVLVAVKVDYSDNYKLFETVRGDHYH